MKYSFADFVATNKKTLAILAVGLLAGPMTASAIEVQSSTSVFLTFRDCVSGVTACDEFTRTLVRSYGGLPGDLTATSSLSDPAYGSLFADAQLSGTVGAPILRTSAVSEPLKRISTNSAALQRYTYTGSVPTTRTFGGSLTYSQVVPIENQDFPLSQWRPLAGVSGILTAELEVFTLSGDFLEVGDTDASNFDSLLFSYSIAPGYVRLGFDNFLDDATNPAGFATLGVTVNLNPGDSVWVRVFLQTPALNGAMVDSSNTFITGWDNSDNLVPASIDPGALLERLGTAVTGVGPGNSLADKIVLAKTYFAVPDVQATCAILTDFGNEVRAQRDKKLTFEMADQLTADAQVIMTAIGCD